MSTILQSRLRQQTVLVAGGAGFLGSWLCEKLIGEGHRVICLDSLQTGATANFGRLANDPRFSFIEADVSEPLPGGLVADRIYNLACPASPRHYQADPVHTLMTSVMGTRNLLALAEETGARLLQASTSEVYGDPLQHPQRESYWGHVNPIGIRACYDEGKRAAETLCFDMLRQRRADVRVARIFNTYGPRMRPDDGRIVSNLVVQALAGQPLTIYGDGSQTRSFCYVADLVAGLQALMEREVNPEGPVNIGNPDEHTVLDLAQTVRRMTKSRSAITFQPLPLDDPHYRRPDISRARELLGWAPQTPLETGLGQTIAWFSSGVHAAGRRERAGAGKAIVAGAVAQSES